MYRIVVHKFTHFYNAWKQNDTRADERHLVIVQKFVKLCANKWHRAGVNPPTFESLKQGCWGLYMKKMGCHFIFPEHDIKTFLKKKNGGGASEHTPCPYFSFSKNGSEVVTQSEHLKQEFSCPVPGRS